MKSLETIILKIKILRRIKMARYKFFEGVNAKGSKMMVCLSSFCKKTVRGIAKCNGDIDEFDVEYGKKLAQARCDEKICEKRVQRATRRLDWAKKNLEFAQAEYERMEKYLADSKRDYDAACEHTISVEAEKK